MAKKNFIMDTAIGFLHMSKRSSGVGQAMWITQWTDAMKQEVLNYAKRHNKKLVGMEAEIEALGFPEGSIIISCTNNPDALMSHPNSLIVRATTHEKAIDRIKCMTDLMIISPSTIFKCQEGVIIPDIRMTFHKLPEADRIKVRRSGAINVKRLHPDFRRTRQTTNAEDVVRTAIYSYKAPKQKIVPKKEKIMTLFDDE